MMRTGVLLNVRGGTFGIPLFANGAKEWGTRGFN